MDSSLSNGVYIQCMFTYNPYSLNAAIMLIKKKTKGKHFSFSLKIALTKELRNVSFSLLITVYISQFNHFMFAHLDLSSSGLFRYAVGLLFILAFFTCPVPKKIFPGCRFS